MNGILWHHAQFRRLWAGQSVSQLGSQVTVLALPLTAALVLHASPLEMGLLNAAQFAPFLLIGLFAGVWVDRVRRQPVLVAADLSRAALLGSVPAAAALGVLSLTQLYVVAFLVGVMTVFFDLAYQAFLPSLVDRSAVVEGNGKLELSRSVAQVAGPSLAGALFPFVAAPLAIALDAASFLASALFIGSIRAAEPSPVRTGPRPGVWRGIGEGMRAVVGDPVLRSIAGCTAAFHLFDKVRLAVYVLYATRELGVGPAALGTILAAGGVGAVGGALVGAAAARRVGLGPTIVGATSLLGWSGLLLAAAGGPPWQVVAMLAAAEALSGLARTTYNVNQVSLRQIVTPDHLQGRANATMRFIVWGMIPLGSLLGGVMGDHLGLRATVLVASLGSLLPFAWALLSPLRTLRGMPTAAPPVAA